MILLPGDPGFAETLAAPPPNWGEVAARDGSSYAFAVRPGSAGVAEAVTLTELEDFIYSGEYDERLDEIEQEEALEAEALPLIWTP